MNPAASIISIASAVVLPVTSGTVPFSPPPMNMNANATAAMATTAHMAMMMPFFLPPPVSEALAR